MAMRSRRSAHVRPRPPSDGRPRRRAPIRPAAPLAGRLSSQRRIERVRRLPLPASVLLVVAIVALGGAVLLSGTDLLRGTVAGVGAAFSGALDRLVPASSTAAPTEIIGFGAPALSAPPNKYTNQATADVSGNVPSSIAGAKGVSVRLYRIAKDSPPALVGEQAVGGTPSFIFAAVPLAPGENDFVATLVGAGRESGQSPVVAYVLDMAPPTVTISAPRNGTLVGAASVTITGRTKGGSSITARDEANSASATATAAADGTFKVTISLAPGPNGITIRATDPAGNVASTVLSLQRSSGQLLISLSASPYRISAKAGGTIVLTALATAPDGSAVAGASVTFTLAMPGMSVVLQEETTDGTGTATWPAPIPPGAATSGLTGLATVQLTTPTQGNASARAAITVIP